MRLINIIILIFGVFTLVVKSQNSLSGKVTDKISNEPVIGATIYVHDLKTGAITDKEGKFVIHNLPKGKCMIEAKSLGYQHLIKEITINGNINLDFELNESIVELNEVVVTGVNRTTEIQHSPVIMKTIDNNYLKQNTSSNIINALHSIPGINDISTGAAIAKPVIRGLGYNRVITLFNGIKQEGQQWGDEHGIEIDEFSVDRVEIIKGPGSLIYGSDGIAGVINFLSANPLPDGALKTSITSEYQSNNNLIGYSIFNAGNKADIQWQARFSNKFAGNYSNPVDGKVFNSEFKEYDGNLFLGINRNWGFSYLTISSFNQTLNITEGDRDSTGKFTITESNGMGGLLIRTASENDLKGYKIGFPHQEVNHFKLVSNNYFNFEKSSINLDLAFQQNLRKEFVNPSIPDEKSLYFVLNSFNYNLKYNLSVINGWENAFGISGMFQTNENKGIEFLVPAYNMLDIGGFVFVHKDLTDNLAFSGGLRIDNRMVSTNKLILDSNDVQVNYENEFTNIKFPGFDENYFGFSGSAGLSYQADENSSIKLNISRGFRAPNISEIGSNGKHEGTFRYEYGTSNLKSEGSLQFDLAYYQKGEHFSLEISPFYNMIQNYIFLEKLVNSNGGDSVPNPIDPAIAFKYKQGNANLFGGEISFDIHPHPFDWFHFENSFSFVRAVQSNQPDSTKNLPLIPPPHYRAELKAQIKNIFDSFNNTFIKVGVDNYFKQDFFYSAFETETTTPGYTLINASIGTDFKLFNTNDFSSLLISVENLTNVAYQSHLSRLKYAPINPATGKMGIYNMGRNINIKLIVHI